MADTKIRLKNKYLRKKLSGCISCDISDFLSRHGLKNIDNITNTLMHRLLLTITTYDDVLKYLGDVAFAEFSEKHKPHIQRETLNEMRTCTELFIWFTFLSPQNSRHRDLQPFSMVDENFWGASSQRRNCQVPSSLQRIW